MSFDNFNTSIHPFSLGFLYELFEFCFFINIHLADQCLERIINSSTHNEFGNLAFELHG